MSQFERLQKAAALKYSETDPKSAPVVVASGSGYAAQKIIDIAEQGGVPVFRDNSLATLLSQLQSGTEIPPELYQAVVDIYVYFLGFRVEGNGKVSRAAAPKPEPAERSGNGGASGGTEENGENGGTGEAETAVEAEGDGKKDG